MRRFLAALAATWFAVMALVACSDDTQDKVEDAASSVREDAENIAGKGAAFVLAQELRAALKAKDLENGETERDVSVLNAVVQDLPGDPDITGIEDGNGDGKDDDGKVEAHVSDQTACLTISEDGKETDVKDDACT
jgi:hypothetical protein